MSVPPTTTLAPVDRVLEAGGLELHHLEYGDGTPAIVVVPGIETPGDVSRGR